MWLCRESCNGHVKRISVIKIPCNRTHQSVCHLDPTSTNTPTISSPNSHNHNFSLVHLNQTKCVFVKIESHFFFSPPFPSTQRHSTIAPMVQHAKMAEDAQWDYDSLLCMFSVGGSSHCGGRWVRMKKEGKLWLFSICLYSA